MSDRNASVPRQHASTGPAPPEMPEPSHAERARTLISLVSVATLSTISRKHPGFPFGSLMPFALDAAGWPIFLISSMAMHTQNLKNDPKCSLFVAQPSVDGDPLGAARATLIGHAEPVPAHDVAAVRETYLARHENSRYWVDFSDFNFFRLQPVDLYYVGGFGVMGWVEAHEYETAVPDPLAASAPNILAHMNADHVDSMILLARRHAQLRDANERLVLAALSAKNLQEAAEQAQRRQMEFLAVLAHDLKLRLERRVADLREILDAG